MRTMSRRNLLGVSAGALALGGLSACGGGKSATDQGGGNNEASGDGGKGGYDGPAVTLAFWNGFTGGDGAYMKKIVDAFHKEHDNIKVEFNTMQWSDFYTKLPTAVSSGKGPDICVMHVDSVATNAARNVIQPLDDVAKALDLKGDDFAEVPWKAGIYKDKRYSLPLDVHPLGFFYNKAVMEKAGLDPEQPPMTHDAYMDALDKLKGKGIKGHWASPHLFTGGQSMQSLVYQFGGSMYNDDATEATWNSPEAVKAFEWWLGLVKDGHSPSKVAQDADFIALQNGECAFNWNGIWAINTLGEKKDLEWDVVRLPNIGGQDAAWSSSHQMALPVQKKPDENKQQASRVFLNYVSEQSVEWAKGGQVPARTEVRESEEFKKLEHQPKFAEQIDVLHFPPTIPGIGDVGAEFDKALNNVMLGGKELKSELDASVSRANKLLEANRKKYEG